MPALASRRLARKPNSSSIEADSSARPRPSTSLAAGSLGKTDTRPTPKGGDADAGKGLVSGTGAGWASGFAAAKTANGSSTGTGATSPCRGCPDCADCPDCDKCDKCGDDKGCDECAPRVSATTSSS